MHGTWAQAERRGVGCVFSVQMIILAAPLRWRKWPRDSKALFRGILVMNESKSTFFEKY
jgi:hypothetical protein